MVTANHYFLDAIGGSLCLGVGYWLGRMLTSFNEARASASQRSLGDPVAGTFALMNPWPPDALAAGVAELAAKVDARILALVDGDRLRWEALDPGLGTPLASLRRLVMAGGKRLRPAFCYWSFRGAGGAADDARVFGAGAALEMLHTSASDPRRHHRLLDEQAGRGGHPRRVRPPPPAAGWQGDGRRFGEGVAILIGDLALVYADMLLGRRPGRGLGGVRRAAPRGQHRPVPGPGRIGRPGCDRASARRIGRYKSAKYTIERPLHLGAAIADPERFGRLAGPL